MTDYTKEQLLARSELPDVPERWTPKRRAVVAKALALGAITIREVCDRYDFSVDECAEMMRRYRMGITKATTKEGRHRGACPACGHAEVGK